MLVIADAKNGYQWKASIGLEKIGPSQFVGPGETLRANGQVFTGPLTYWPKSRLKEASVLGNGADHTVRVSIAARAKRWMNWNGRGRLRRSMAPS